MSNFEEALERFQQLALEYADGLAHHGPMGAEALESLGHHAKIPAFVDVYAPRLPPIVRGDVLDAAQEADALGRMERAPDWIATFEARVDRDGVAGVLSRTLPRLLPGLFAGAGHGLLRVAHGLRALERATTPARQREVAHGLAYWAARFQRLPGAPRAWSRDGQCVADAMAAWPLLGEPDARAGYFFRVVERLDGWAPFEAALAGVAMPPPEEVEPFLDALCLASAGLYLRNPAARIAYVHAVTIPSALRDVLPYLDEAAQVQACGFGLQAVAALHSIFGEPDGEPESDDEVERIADGEWEEIRYHAACSIEEHSIKMVDACAREDARRPNPVFRRAAADAALKIGGWGQRASVC